MSKFSGDYAEVLCLAYTSIDDLSFVRHFPSVKALLVEGTKISSLAGFNEMDSRHFEELKMNQTIVDDLSPLKNHHVERLLCQDTRVSSLENINTSYIKWLEVDGSRVNDLKVFVRAKFPVLHSLGLSKCWIKDIAALSGLNLRELNISHTPVGDLSPLAGMPLENLNIKATQVADITPLKNCPLEELTFSPERIVKGMAALRKIRTLRSINGKPAQAFWSAYTKLERGGK